MEQISSNSNWGSEAAKMNRNFQSLEVDVQAAKNSSVRAKGLFPTLTDLRNAYPSPVRGDWAVVGSTIPGLVYECRTNGTWVSSGQQGGGGDVDLAGYVSSMVITNPADIL